MATIVGSPIGENLPGTDQADDMAGLGGNDIMQSGLGDDQVDGGEGDDLMDGGPDNDTLFGGPGDDDMTDGLHDDSLFGGIGDDTLRSIQGFDNLDGGAGDDVLIGIFGYANMVGGTGNDTLSAGTGGSSQNGGEGDDSMTGGIGSDFFRSEENDADTITVVRFQGDFGFDTVNGFNSGDTLRFVGFEPGDLRVEERAQFPGPIFFSSVDGAISTNAAGVELAADTSTDEAVSKIASIYGPPLDAVTTFANPLLGSLTVDAVGLVEGRDYFFVPGPDLFA